MNQSPAISVVLPVYNAEAYVREAVESILAQTFTDFELIIINIAAGVLGFTIITYRDLYSRRD